jgi:hypothetical protein
MFILSEELKFKKCEEIKKGQEVKCFELITIHKTKLFLSILYTTKEKAMERAIAHANKHPRLDVRYIVTNGRLNNNFFTPDYMETYKVHGIKQGREIKWQES